MATIGSARVKTDVVQLGYNVLYEPRAFKGKGKDADSDKKTQQSNDPTFSVQILLDKKKDISQIKRIWAAQRNAIEDAKAEGILDKNSNPRLKFFDADSNTEPTSDTDPRKIISSKKRPEWSGKYVLKANLKAKNGRRPGVGWLSPDGRTIKLPDPILHPDPDDKAQVEQADRIADLWSRLVYEGQNVMVTVTFGVYVMPTGVEYITCRLDNVLIIGGGVPVNTVPFDADFGDRDELSKVLAWRKKYSPDYKPELDPWGKEMLEIAGPVDDDDSVRAEVVDDEPEEAVEEEPVRPKRRRRPAPEPEDVEDDVEEEPAPKPHRRRKLQPEPEPEYDEETGELADDEPQGERRARRTASSRRPLRKPADVEPDDEYEADEDEYDDSDLM